jgi:hypothetical protein
MVSCSKKLYHAGESSVLANGFRGIFNEGRESGLKDQSDSYSPGVWGFVDRKRNAKTWERYVSPIHLLSRLYVHDRSFLYLV